MSGLNRRRNAIKPTDCTAVSIKFKDGQEGRKERQEGLSGDTEV